MPRYRELLVYEEGWYRPEYQPVCDECERPIRGEYAEITSHGVTRFLCAECAESAHSEDADETIEWAIEWAIA